MTDSARLLEARALTATLDKLSRNPKRFSPSAPWIIPATMIVVAIFALICLAIKLIMNYLHSRNETTKDFKHSHGSSPDIPTTPEDQASMATTASMKTRNSLGLSGRRQHRGRPPPVSLYQIKQKQSPGSAGSKTKISKAALKAMARGAKAEANSRNLSRDKDRQNDDDGSDDNSNNVGDNSPNLSQRSDDTDEVTQAINQPGLAYGAATSKAHADEVDADLGHGSNQPEVHIVQIRDLEADLQHPQTTWPNAESEI